MALTSKSRIKKRSAFSFSPKINLLLLFIVAIGTFVTVAALQQRQDVRQQAASQYVPAPVDLDKLDQRRQPADGSGGSIIIRDDQVGGIGGNTIEVPNPVCGGSGQGSVCPSMRPNQQVYPNNPNQGNPNQGPNQNQPWNPNPQPSNEPGEIAPGEPNPNGGIGGGGNGGNTGGNANGLLNRIIEMLNQIIQLLQQLLGGGGGTPNPGNPNPGNPQPSTNPGDPGNPNPSNPQPSTNPGDPGNPGNPQPSTAPSTAAPSTAPSGATGDTTPPSAPTNLTATVVSDSQIRLSWSRSTDNVGVTKYTVYRSEGDASTGGNSGITFQREVGTATSYTDSNLKAGTRYYYYVRAFDAANNKSEHSNTAGGTTKAKNKPNSLKVTVGLSGQSSLKDKKIPIQLDGPNGYSKTSTQGNTVNKTDSYTFTGLDNGKYTLHISYGTYKSVTTTITFDKSGGGETISKSYTLAK